MTARTLYGRLFSLVPGHFSRRGKIHAIAHCNYYEKFKFGENTGEFFFYLHGGYNMEVSTITIKNPSSSTFLFEEYKIRGNYVTHVLQSIDARDQQITTLSFDDLSDEIHDLLDKKTDNDIINCSCCGYKPKL